MQYFYDKSFTLLMSVGVPSPGMLAVVLDPALREAVCLDQLLDLDSCTPGL